MGVLEIKLRMREQGMLSVFERFGEFIEPEVLRDDYMVVSSALL
jgi:hypothetical protein